MPHMADGVLVLVMVCHRRRGPGRAQARARRDGRSRDRPPEEPSLGNKIFLRCCSSPSRLGFALAFRLVGGDTSRGALVGLGFGGAAALIVGLWLTKSRAREAFEEGRRLNDSMGSVIILPQLLASLGVIFTASKVGELIAAGIKGVIPGESLFLLSRRMPRDDLFHAGGGNSSRPPVITPGVWCRSCQAVRRGPGDGRNDHVTRAERDSVTRWRRLQHRAGGAPQQRDPYGVIKFQVPFAMTMWAMPSW